MTWPTNSFLFVFDSTLPSMGVWFELGLITKASTSYSIDRIFIMIMYSYHWNEYMHASNMLDDTWASKLCRLSIFVRMRLPLVLDERRNLQWHRKVMLAGMPSMHRYEFYLIFVLCMFMWFNTNHYMVQLGTIRESTFTRQSHRHASLTKFMANRSKSLIICIRFSTREVFIYTYTHVAESWPSYVENALYEKCSSLDILDPFF